jgi:hypothetical protein
VTYLLQHEGRTFTPDGEIPAPVVRSVLNCGHPPREPGSITAGYALIMGSYTVCYDCMDEWERSFMAGMPAFTCYWPGAIGQRITSEPLWLTTWTGGTLARITRCTRSRRIWMPTGGTYRRVDIWATAPDGSRWYGHGTDSHNLITIRRIKTQSEIKP